jgi:uncharacterized cupredoxin-like copper-binding protein
MTALSSVRDSPRVDRTVAITVDDHLRFAPESLTTRAGETVAFKVSNTGTEAHEFVIGDESVQQVHEQRMARGAGMVMADDVAYAIAVPAGQSATLVYTFANPGSLIYGCHVLGHYAAGMRGTIAVQP